MNVCTHFYTSNRYTLQILHLIYNDIQEKLFNDFWVGLPKYHAVKSLRGENCRLNFLAKKA